MKIVKIIIFIVVALALITSGVFYNRRSDKAMSDKAAAEREQKAKEMADVLSKLQKEDVIVGTGEEAKNGDTLTVNYEGTLENGTKFDSSYDRKQPFKFTLGAGNVIQGWDLGILGMKVGGKRKLVIPPELGYGASGAGRGIIPPNATLKFTVELLNVESPKK